MTIIGIWLIRALIRTTYLVHELLWFVSKIELLVAEISIIPLPPRRSMVLLSGSLLLLKNQVNERGLPFLIRVRGLSFASSLLDFVAALPVALVL